MKRWNNPHAEVITCDKEVIGKVKQFVTDLQNGRYWNKQTYVVFERRISMNQIQRIKTLTFKWITYWIALLKYLDSHVIERDRDGEKVVVFVGCMLRGVYEKSRHPGAHRTSAVIIVSILMKYFQLPLVITQLLQMYPYCKSLLYI